MSKKTQDIKRQSDAFTNAARELGCDESETHFDASLKKVVQHKPIEGKPSAPHGADKKEKGK